MILDVRDLLDNEEQAVELFTNGMINYTGDDVELITLSQILKTAGKDTTWEPKTKTTKKCHRIQCILYDGGDVTLKDWPLLRRGIKYVNENIKSASSASVTFELKRKSGNKGLKAGNEMISANDRMHHIVKAGITKHLRELGKNNTPQNVTFSKEYPCNVTITIHPPTKRRMDAPNWYPTIKALIDGLTDGGLWTDDNNEVIQSLTFKGGGLSGSDMYKIEISVINT